MFTRLFGLRPCRHRTPPARARAPRPSVMACSAAPVAVPGRCSTLSDALKLAAAAASTLSTAASMRAVQWKGRKPSTERAMVTSLGRSGRSHASSRASSTRWHASSPALTRVRVRVGDRARLRVRARARVRDRISPPPLRAPQPASPPAAIAHAKARAAAAPARAPGACAPPPPAHARTPPRWCHCAYAAPRQQYPARVSK